ncbi:MAG: tRNA (N(6)-L-threonylcarbamoyladenosine(37)-C(2))-methylthiotransferase MtaB [Candidatus Kryptoniota bacterium]
MEKKRVALESLGCKLNYAETIQIEKEFKRRGYDVVSPTSSADVFIINTCTVTQSADSDCRQIVRRALRSSPNAFVVVTGCYAQGKPNEVAQIEGVDLVLGAKEKFELFEHVNDFIKPKGGGCASDTDYHARVFVGPIDDAVEFGAADSATSGRRTRAFLKVQDGCDYKCSYCTIPKVRGESRSPSVGFLVQEATEIAARGFKEIVLSGVNVGDFHDSDNHSLIDLLKELDKVAGIERIRISSIEPNLLTKEIIKFAAASSRLCRHFHVPLQSGSDYILKKMRRRYNSNDYRDIVEQIKEVMPSAGIGADVIVGFPGETNADFEQTYDFIESLPLTYLHVFSYSEREGTDAASLNERVDPRARKKRSELLRMLSIRKRYEFNRRHVGRIIRVLIEEEVKNEKMFGFTSNYVRVEMDASASRVNEIADVLVTGVSDNTVIGQVIL